MPFGCALSVRQPIAVCTHCPGCFVVPGLSLKPPGEVGSVPAFCAMGKTMAVPSFCLSLVCRSVLVLGRFQGEHGATGKAVQSPPCLRTPGCSSSFPGGESAPVPLEGENISLSLPAPQAAGCGQFVSLVPLILDSKQTEHSLSFCRGLINLLVLSFPLQLASLTCNPPPPPTLLTPFGTWKLLFTEDV